MLVLLLFRQILSVERFVKSVNGALRSQQESERLHGIMDRIENYEVVVWAFKLKITHQKFLCGDNLYGL